MVGIAIHSYTIMCIPTIACTPKLIIIVAAPSTAVHGAAPGSYRCACPCHHLLLASSCCCPCCRH